MLSAVFVRRLTPSRVCAPACPAPRWGGGGRRGRCAAVRRAAIPVRSGHIQPLSSRRVKEGVVRKWITASSTPRWMRRIASGACGILSAHARRSRVWRMRLLWLRRVPSCRTLGLTGAAVWLRRCSAVQQRIVSYQRPAVVVHPAHRLSEIQLKKHIHINNGSHQDEDVIIRTVSSIVDPTADWSAPEPK
jgi:hypothetical protein